jgi:hypothetical protein
VLLLRSANDQHPNSLANSSDVVGRYYMAHINSAMPAISKSPNSTRFQKTLGVNDYYWGAEDFVRVILKRDVPPARIPLFTNAVHWIFGTMMGGAYGLLHGTLRRRAALDGPAFGLSVWAQSYATLVPLGLYKPPWAYSARTIAKDISYHLVYGAGTAAGYKLVERVR